MQLQQLELIAFGEFTNKTLAFSQPQKLHLIYGANEAGKSTTLRALTALLFGFPERTPDAYFHPSDKLLLGATLIDQEGELLHCYRRKGRKNTLLSKDNVPLDEDILQKVLNYVHPNQFSALFCLDHSRLTQGGEDLLNSHGEVGKSLFEAGTGTLKIHELLNSLDKEADTLFKARGSKPKLNQTIKIYKEACQRMKSQSLSASKWKEHTTQLENAHARYKVFNDSLQDLRTTYHRLGRIQRTRPLLQRHEELVTALKELEPVIILPDDAKTQRIETNLALHTAESQRQQSEKLLNELRAQLAKITIPSELLAQKTQIDALREQLGSHLKAARDLPGVRTEMRTVENEAKALLQRIYPDLQLTDLRGFSEKGQLGITDQERAKLKELTDEYPILREKQSNINERLEKTTQQLLQLRKSLMALPQVPDLTKLKVAVNHALKQGDIEESLAKDDKALRLITVKAEIGLKQLGLWSGNLETLEQLPLPNAERIEHFDQRFKELETDKQRIKEKLLDARQRYAQATQKIEALRWSGEVPTEADLTQSRQVRQQHWQSLKHTQPDAEMYQAFEEAMLRADEVADRLRREAHRVAEQANLLAEQQSAQREQELQTKKWRTLNDLFANLQDEWETCWQACDIKPWTPTEMRAWLTECLNLRQQISTLREHHQQLDIKQQRVAELCQHVSEALSQLPNATVPLTHLSDLIEQAQASIDEFSHLQHQREDLERQIQNTEMEQQRWETKQSQIEQALTDWQVMWEKALKPLQLSPDTTSETARQVLDLLDQITSKLDKIKGLKRRVARMEEDALQFRQEVATLVNNIALEWQTEEAETVIPKLSARLSEAEKDSTRYEQLQQRITVEQTDLNKAQSQLQQAQVRMQSLLAQAHCDDLDNLEQAELLSSQKKELQRQLKEVEQQLLEQGEGLSLADLAEDVQSVDVNTLPAQMQNTAESIQELEKMRSELDQSIGELRTLLKQMDGNDAAAQAADEAQLALSEMQDLSERYMQVALAASVLRKSIDRYREQHQAPVLQRASILFNQFTLGRFSRLQVGYNNNDQPIILGIRDDDNLNVSMTGMSDGTRDQLYLALRLASIEQYLEKHGVLPLILDDILINFDDERAIATLKVLLQLSEKMQILFFTHHRHLIELAQQHLNQDQLVLHYL